MKKILVSLMTIALVIGITGAGFAAYLSDVETSGSNVFAAGSLNLRVDLMSSTHRDAEGTILGGPRHFGMRDLNGEVFFNWSDIKPGDEGEATISLHVDNDAWARMVSLSTANDDNGLTEPEEEGDWDTDSRTFENADSSDGAWNGELPKWLHVTMWRDDDCDNKKDDSEDYLIGKKLAGEDAILVKDVTLEQSFPDIFDKESDEWSRIPGYLEACKTNCIGISWYVHPAAGNEIQSDSVALTASFEVSQKRNQLTTPYQFKGE